jgi:anion-transporting  ArsA/GET3 family ATPase
MLISTDPAHSLADVLQITVGDTAASISDLPNLRVRYLDAATQIFPPIFP